MNLLVRLRRWQAAFGESRSSPVWPGSMLLHVGLLLVAFAALICGLGVLVWFGLGRPALSGPLPTPGATPGPSASVGQRPLTAAERLDSLKLVLTMVGGVGAIVALTVAYRKQRQGEVAERREDTKLYAERYVKATDQLGNDNHRVRVAGIYAIAELADDWDSGRQLCVDVLCAYVRMPYENPDKGEREVRRTLFRIIRNHLRPEAHWSRVKWSDCRFSFEGPLLDKGDLSRAELNKNGNMTFHGATFAGGFDLTKIRLNGAPIWFTKTTFSGSYVTFSGADFQGSEVSFNGATFAAGNITFDQVTGGTVTFDGATHTGATVDWGPFPPVAPTP